MKATRTLCQPQGGTTEGSGSFAVLRTAELAFVYRGAAAREELLCKQLNPHVILKEARLKDLDLSLNSG